ncbi:hypothetical protein GCM10009836_26920 [Pseudonocardia ailaonensis]|uniref:STAS domain-containing protein n=1 Tax=Pseudonocardia ailaonensis TaxID=367279 RepID=A0ABN2N0L2_9PSEU
MRDGAGRGEIDPPALEVRHETLRSGVVAVRLAGELDTDTAGRLHEALQSAILGARAVVVDLAAVSYLGSAGVSALLGAHTRAGDRVHLAGLEGNRSVHKVVDLLGLTRHFVVHDDVPAFLTALRA